MSYRQRCANRFRAFRHAQRHGRVPEELYRFQDVVRAVLQVVDELAAEDIDMDAARRQALADRARVELMLRGIERGEE